ncbi:hypothetical protein EJ05DRAFT_480556 [Pseudovirgaria hyperparasitica]|uniref:Extracellular membrane protein CFEM domain-containing protein n=1 Tax=Pseudovirgaria hyperparasitica TaxID=470096 RepID=A0A6A6VTY3_9PEZI|nr:uncharacterized protein EJ05DRAFT_480556 [Pseudovirgaria hyperparasitica]KAF2753194.1 hypothetical protein EJ05DRAFT_480556 [Pseudovirgaria hyperparasitica]
MKFSTLALTTFAAAVCAQDAPTTVHSAPSMTVSLRPEVSCVNACPIGDVNCQARCVGVPFPDENQTNQTNECAGKCDQGDGSPEATEKFSQCVQGCISSYFLTATAAPTAGGAAPSGGAAPTGAGQTTGPSSGSPSETGSGAQPSGSQGAAAGSVQMNVATGFVGLFMAMLAL